MGWRLFFCSWLLVRHSSVSFQTHREATKRRGENRAYIGQKCFQNSTELLHCWLNFIHHESHNLFIYFNFSTYRALIKDLSCACLSQTSLGPSAKVAKNALHYKTTKMKASIVLYKDGMLLLFSRLEYFEIGHSHWSIAHTRVSRPLSVSVGSCTGINVS